MEIREVIVVEGRSDSQRIKEAVTADTIETNGSALDEATIDRIAKLASQRGVIVFTDPDYPGEKIRKTISQRVPSAKHAFIPRQLAKGNKVGQSLGIEHASPEVIRQALSQVYTPVEKEKETDIDRELLAKLKLINHPQAKKRREALGIKLNIGYSNGKQLLKRLRMFDIDAAKLKESLVQVDEEEDRD